MVNQQCIFAESTVGTMVTVCNQGHGWQPTVILGYFQCLRCKILAACRIRVSKVRGKPLAGFCQQHLSTPETTEEVL